MKNNFLAAAVILILSIAFPNKVNAQYSCLMPPVSRSTLSEYASRKNLNIGGFINECLEQPSDASLCKQTVAREFANQSVPFENDWLYLEVSPDVWDWRRFDGAINFAKSTNTKIHFYHLIWQPSIHIHPQWLFTSPYSCGNWTRDQLLEIMKDFIKTTISHGNDWVSAWNIVNEAFADTDTNEAIGINGFRQNCFYKIIGPDYVDHAFRFAREASPKGKLIINDYFGSGGFGRMSRTKVDNFIYYVGVARSRGVPIEGVGIQNHLLSSDGSQFTGVYRDDLDYFFKKAQEIGVNVYLTEMNVYHPQYNSESIAQVYQDTMSICLKYSNCVSLGVWGISDKYSDVRTALGITAAQPLLFNDQYAKKPAYFGLMTAMKNDTSRTCGANPADINGNGKVDILDYNTFVTYQGTDYNPNQLDIFLANF